MKNPNLALLLFLKDKLTLRAHTKEELAARWLEKGNSEINEKTINRNVEYLSQLGYEVHYGYINRKRSYHIVDEYEHEILEKIQNNLRISKVPELANSGIVTSAPSQKGVQFIPLLMESIHHFNCVNFVYHYHNRVPAFKRVCPVILKEFQGEWHLYGYDLEKQWYRMYGVDRILDLKKGGIYNWDQLPDLEMSVGKFKSLLGAAQPLPNYFQDEKSRQEIIELRVSSFLLNYLRAKPIHFSQEIIEGNKVTYKKIDSDEMEDFILVKFYLIPNIILVKYIVSQLGDVLIEKPEKLKEYIRAKYPNVIDYIS